MSSRTELDRVLWRLGSRSSRTSSGGWIRFTGVALGGIAIAIGVLACAVTALSHQERTARMQSILPV